LSDVRIGVSGGDLRCYLARPAGRGPWPGVLVLHDLLGMTPDVHAQADWLAGAGYLALAPDLYSTGGKLRCLVSTFRELAAGQGQVFAKADACRSWLASQEDCTGHVGVIGYCMGGGFALLLAPGHGFEAASANYGMVPRNAAEFFRQSCPVVGSYGARDRTLRGAAGELTAALDSAGVDHDIKEYQDAGHSFLNDHPGALAMLRGAAGRDAALPRLFAVFTAVSGPLMGMGYHEPSAADARGRIVEFFDQHLKV
jgi:carboxymethylenebutenolidase